MTATNEVLIIVLGVAVLLLGVADEFSAPANRFAQLAGALLGVAVIMLALLR